MLKTINDEYLIAIGAAIREKNGTEETYKPSEMAAAISAITGGEGGTSDIEIPKITGDCSYRFANGGWNWIIRDYGDKITTEKIYSCAYMFYNTYRAVFRIPFEINCVQNVRNFDNQTITSNNLSNMFSGCLWLEEIPKINNAKPSNIRNMFNSCRRIRYFPEDIGDWFDWSVLDSNTTISSARTTAHANFSDCYSLRKAPMCFLEHRSSYQKYFYNCYVLDEIKDFPIVADYATTATTSNLFQQTFYSCHRVKDIIFKSYATDIKWKNQTIDLKYNIGYMPSTSGDNFITGHNSGITTDTKITDDATYQALKNDPDSWTKNGSYSRYNHDSAVRTINSLPDTSAYLAEVGGTNTIIFNGTAGSRTDGGAINTLTDAEIAVATAKGWTITFA